MKVINVNDETSNKYTVEIERTDVVNMQDRILDVVRQEITKCIIAEITKQILSDEKYINGIKEKVIEQISKSKIENIELF